MDGIGGGGRAGSQRVLLLFSAVFSQKEKIIYKIIWFIK
jgi:hypothetical protein